MPSMGPIPGPGERLKLFEPNVGGTLARSGIRCEDEAPDEDRKGDLPSLRKGEVLELLARVLEYGDLVEVIEPPSLRARVRDTLTVRAPVDARFGSIAVADRAAVAANAPLMTVVDLSRLEVELQAIIGATNEMGFESLSCEEI